MLWEVCIKKTLNKQLCVRIQKKKSSSNTSVLTCFSGQDPYCPLQATAQSGTYWLPVPALWGSKMCPSQRARRSEPPLTKEQDHRVLLLCLDEHRASSFREFNSHLQVISSRNFWGTFCYMPTWGVHFQSHLPMDANLKAQEKISAGKTRSNPLDSQKFGQAHEENSCKYYNRPPLLLPIKMVGV